MVDYNDPDFVLKGLRGSYNVPEFSDVTISLSNGVKIFCHKAVLSNGSSLFRRMLAYRERETTASELELDGEPNAIECMLRFLYTGHCKLSDGNIAAATALADCFNVQQLHDSCLDFLNVHLQVTDANCINLLASGFHHKVDKVFNMAAQYIITERKDSEGFQNFAYPLMESFVKQGKQYPRHLMKLISIINRWIEGPRPSTVCAGIILLLDLDLSVLSFDELADFCRMKIVQCSPELQHAVVQAMGSK